MAKNAQFRFNVVFDHRRPQCELLTEGATRLRICGGSSSGHDDKIGFLRPPDSRPPDGAPIKIVFGWDPTERDRRAVAGRMRRPAQFRPPKCRVTRPAGIPMKRATFSGDDPVVAT